MVFNTGQATDVPLLGEIFRHHTVFKLLTTKVHQSYRKISVHISVPIMEKFQNFAAKGFIGTLIHIFLPSSVEIDKSKVTKRVHDIHQEKVGMLHLSPWLHCGLPKISQDHSFPIPYPSAKFCPKPSRF